MPAGSGAIKGRVIDAQTGSALVRARVRLNWMGPGTQRPPVSTDESGAFAFTALPAGSFTLMADKSTYIAGRYPEGGQTLRTVSRSLTLSDGQTIDSVAIAMYHGGAITGRVVDAHGDPVEFAQVQALRLPKSGRGKPQQASGSSSNDLGEFRLARLSTGKYLILVQPQRRDFGPPGPPGTPEIVEPQPVPTFYPNVQGLDQAQPITVERGNTVVGVDVMLADGVPAQVTGVLLDASGQPVTRNGNVTIRPILKDVSNYGSTGTGVRPDGTFQIKLTPGEYEFEGRATPAGLTGPPPPGSEQYGTVRVNMAGELTGVVIQLGPGAKVTGRVVFDGTSPVPQASTNTNGPGAVMFVGRDGPGCRSGRGQVAQDWTFTVEGLFGTCTAQFNGGAGRWFVKSITYEGKELMDQPLTFAAGQQMRNVEVLLTDRRTEVTFHVSDDQGAATRDYVGLLFSVDKARWSDNGSRYVRTIVPPVDPPVGAASPSTTPGGAGANRTFISGRVVGGMSGGVVGPGGLVTSMSTGMTSNRELMSGMPAGEYYAIAVDDLEQESSRDPDFLEQLSRGATRVTVTEGSPTDVNLRRIKISQSR